MTHPHTDLTTTARALAVLADTFLRDMVRQDADREAWSARMDARRRAEQAAMWLADEHNDLQENGL